MQSGLEEMQIPKNVTVIESSAFAQCENLKGVIFAADSQLKTIDDSAFYLCKNLNVISLPEGLEKIGR